MNTNRRHAVAALIAAGLLWGTTVPLSKLALEWLSPGWLTAARFGLAAAVLLAVAAPDAPAGRGCAPRSRPRCWPRARSGTAVRSWCRTPASARTSVTHAALLIGATPVLVAIIAAVWHRTVARPVAWVGFVVSLLGVGLVRGRRRRRRDHGRRRPGAGVALPVRHGHGGPGRLLTGRDPVAVTAVQFLGATVGALLVAMCTQGAPALPGQPGSGAGRCRADGGRHAGAVHAVRVRPEAGCPPRSPGRSSTSSRWSAPSRARRRSGTRLAWRRSPAARPSWRASA